MPIDLACSPLVVVDWEERDSGKSKTLDQKQDQMQGEKAYHHLLANKISEAGRIEM